MCLWRVCSNARTAQSSRTMPPEWTAPKWRTACASNCPHSPATSQANWWPTGPAAVSVVAAVFAMAYKSVRISLPHTITCPAHRTSHASRTFSANNPVAWAVLRWIHSNRMSRNRSQCPNNFWNSVPEWRWSVCRPAPLPARTWCRTWRIKRWYSHRRLPTKTFRPPSERRREMWSFANQFYQSKCPIPATGKMWCRSSVSQPALERKRQLYSSGVFRPRIARMFASMNIQWNGHYAKLWMIWRVVNTHNARWFSVRLFFQCWPAVGCDCVCVCSSVLRAYERSHINRSDCVNGATCLNMRDVIQHTTRTIACLQLATAANGISRKLFAEN